MVRRGRRASCCFALNILCSVLMISPELLILDLRKANNACATRSWIQALISENLHEKTRLLYDQKKQCCTLVLLDETGQVASSSGRRSSIKQLDLSRCMRTHLE